MAIIRWNQLNDLTRREPNFDFATQITDMQREIDRIFDRLLWSGGSTNNLLTTNFMPAVDIVERENDYLVKAELPGMRKEDVTISIQNDVLTLRGEKKDEKKKDGKNYHRVERSVGQFQRSFNLPASVDEEKVEATYADGILTINLPKVEGAKPKEITINVK